MLDTDAAAEIAIAPDVAPPVDAASDAPMLPDVPLATTCAITPPTLATGHLTAESTRLHDALGRAVILRGVNAGSRSKFAPYMPFEFSDETSFTAGVTRLMTTVDGWGMNVIRLPFTWDAMEPTRGTFDEAYLGHYRALLDAAWARGLRVIVDFHQDAYAQVLCGDGFPAWTLGTLPHGAPHHDCPMWFQQYFAPNSTVQLAFYRLYANQDGIADAMEAMWREMARRFGAHPAVMGFEVLNEPGWGTMDVREFERTTLPPFVTRMARAIQSVAPGAMVLQGGPGADALGGATMFQPPDVTPYVYAPHFYDPLVILGASYGNPASARARLLSLVQAGYAWDRPVLLGEFGGSYDSVDLGRFMRDVYDTLDRTLAHGTAWEVSFSAEEWNGERLNMLQGDGTERAFVAEVVRGYARVVDGRIERMEWNARAHTFVLEVSGGGSLPSEVFVPVRHVGSAPRIGIDAGCVSWDAATGVLRVSPAGPRWTLLVQPSA